MHLYIKVNFHITIEGANIVPVFKKDSRAQSTTILTHFHHKCYLQNIGM